jgi:hypothetical protein
MNNFHNSQSAPSAGSSLPPLSDPPDGLKVSEWDGSLWAYSGDQLHDYGDKCFRAGMAYARSANTPAAANAVALPPLPLKLYSATEIALHPMPFGYYQANDVRAVLANRAPVTSAAALSDAPLYSTRQDADRWRTMVQLTLEDTMVDLVEAEIAKRPERAGLTDRELQEEMVACLTSAVDAARRDRATAKGAAGQEGGEA